MKRLNQFEKCPAGRKLEPGSPVCLNCDYCSDPFLTYRGLDKICIINCSWKDFSMAKKKAKRKAAKRVAKKKVVRVVKKSAMVKEMEKKKRLFEEGNGR